MPLSHRHSLRMPSGRAAVVSVLVALLGCLAASRAGARPHPSSSVRWLDFPQVHVVGDGTAYTHVAGLGFGWSAGIRLDSDSDIYGVATWRLVPVVDVAGAPLFLLREAAASGSFNAGSRPKVFQDTVGGSFTPSYVSDWAVGVCEQGANHYRQLGWSEHRIYATERILAVKVFTYLDWTTGNVAALQGTGGPFFTEVVCEPFDFPIPEGPGGMAAETEFKLLRANLELSPGYFEGKCPHDLQLDLEVRANHKGPFRARIESTEGWRSEEYTGQTGEAEPGTGFWRKRIHDTLSVPYDVPVPPGPGPSPYTATGDMAPGTGAGGGEDDDHKPGTGGGPIAVGGDLVDPTPSNVHKAALRLVAVSGDQRVTSRWESFTFRCRPTQAVGQPDEMTQPPRPPVVDPPPPAAPAPTTPTPAAPTPAAPTPAAPTHSAPSGSSSPGGAETSAAKPDLAIGRAGTRGGLLLVTVRNLGAGEAPASSLAVACAVAQGTLAWRAEVPPLRARSERSLRIAVPPGASVGRGGVEQGCRLQLDPDGRVEETNEGNNVHECPACAVTAARGKGR